ncbi:amidohydrolase [Naumannella sp. ID2617S]|nr:amidohydrolase [Naumannella sp. ID2617S]
MTVIDDAHAQHEELRRFRRALHGEPELGLQLPRTQERVLSELDGLDLEITLGKTVTSVGGVLRGGAASGPTENRPTVLLRADMDALPVQEQTGVDFASQVEGRMHACGHDLHTAMLVGAARILNDRRDRLPGDVVLMFQPGEEGFDGARYMVEEGILDLAGRRVDAAFGMHVMSSIFPHAKFASRPGPLMSASDEIHVTVHGAGGHGSTPHRAKDPVVVAAEITTALQTLVTRHFDMFDPVVITVGRLAAGTKANVIPAEAQLEATIRSYSASNRDRLEELVPQLITGIARAHGVDAEVDYRRQYPVTVNDAAEDAFVARTAAELFGADRYLPLVNPVAGSEDFSRVLDEVPGAFVFLSALGPDGDPEAAPYNHSPFATFDDQVLADGAALYAELAIRRLGELADGAAA